MGGVEEHRVPTQILKGGGHDLFPEPHIRGLRAVMDSWDFHLKSFKKAFSLRNLFLVHSVCEAVAWMV